jgi:Ca2+-binding RTX toxin-like protein
LDGGEGEDTISYATALGGGVRANLSTTDISVNAVNIVALRADAQAGGDSGTDTLVSGIENVDGSPFADVLVGDQTANRLSGADGDDILVGRDGNDRLDGGGQVLGDTVDYAQAPGFVTVNLTTNLANGSGSGQDDLTGIENVTGSAAADSLTGDNNANALVGGSGNDLLSGVGGDDNLVGGADDDVLIGGLGNDALIGGTAAVTPSGVDTADFSSAGSGVTVDLSSPPPGGFPVHPAFGGLPPQYASGGAGSDSLSGITNAVGSSSADTLIGNASGNTLTGGAGTDNLVGNAGADTLNGLDGNDTLDGGANDDNLSGGAQRDTLIGGPGDDITAGGDDIDTVDYSGVTGAGVRVNLGAASVTLEIGALAGQRATPDAGASNVGTDTVTTVEEVIGSQFRDVMVGDAGVNSFDGGFGDDLLFGGAGNDSLDGGPGEGDRVTYFGLPSGVTLNLATGTSSGAASGSDNITGVEDVTGSNADDTVDGDSNVNEIAGGSGNDTLRGGDGDDIITAGDGNDNLVGGLGNDVLLGGTAQASPSGVDTVDYSGAASAVTVNLTGPAPGAFPVLAGFTGTPDQYAQGGAGSDALAGINNVTGSPNADVITGSAADNRLLGASGNDMILGMAGVDAIDGGLGDDILAGGLGNDELIGADGVDTVQYNDRAGPFGMGVDLRAGLAAPLVAPLFGADLPGFGTTEDTLAFVEKALGSSFADIFRGDANANTFSGNGAPGGQADTIDYSTAPNAVTVDLSLSTASGPGSGTDTFDGIGNVVGTNLPDTLIGDDSANLILGGDGTDTLVGNGGTDILRGGNSTDTVTYAGSPQPVVVDLSAGAPQAFGAGIGNDTLDSVENVTGSAFSDTLTGNGVGNVLLGLQGNDFLIGLAGNDTLDGGDGTDTVLFTASLFGVKVNLAGTTSGTTPGNSAVGFSTGTDTLLSVEDVLGSQGNDELTGGAGPNRLDGGNGFDTVSYAVSAALPGVSVDLAAGTGGGGGVGTDALDFIENVIGSSGNDSLRGTNGNNSMLGLGGDDTIVGLDGPDSMDGGAGYDTLDYAEATGGVTVDLLTPFPQQTQGAGYDYIVLNSFEKVVGSSFNDTLTGSGTANEIIGGSGDDVIAAGAGADIVSGGPGDDLLKGGPGNDTLTAGPGNDTLIGGSGNDVEDGEAGNDRLIQDFVPNGSDTLRGGDGNDTADYGQRFSGFGVNVVLDGAPGDGSASENDNVGADNSIENVSGGAGNDTLIGNAEVNILNGGGGSDQIDGGLGRDFENGDAGDDTFNQGTAPNGGDVLTGGTGTDTVNYASRTGALAVRFNNIADDGEAGEGDSTPDDIEGATGGSGNDVFQAGGGLSRVVFTGGQGDDSLTGGLGGDLLRGGDGTDTIVGGAGADELFGDGGDDLLFANDSSPDVRIDGGAGTNDFARFDSVDDFPAILIGIEVKDRR